MFTCEQVSTARLELLVEAIEELRAAIRALEAEPSDENSDRLVDALATLIGSGDTHSLLGLAARRGLRA